MPDVPNDLIVPKVAAKLVRAHVATVYRLVHRGELPAYRRGGRYLISRAAALALLVPVEAPPAAVTTADEGDVG